MGNGVASIWAGQAPDVTGREGGVGGSNWWLARSSAESDGEGGWG